MNFKLPKIPMNFKLPNFNNKSIFGITIIVIFILFILFLMINNTKEGLTDNSDLIEKNIFDSVELLEIKDIDNIIKNNKKIDENKKKLLNAIKTYKESKTKESKTKESKTKESTAE